MGSGASATETHVEKLFEQFTQMSGTNPTGLDDRAYYILVTKYHTEIESCTEPLDLLPCMIDAFTEAAEEATAIEAVAVVKVVDAAEEAAEAAAAIEAVDVVKVAEAAEQPTGHRFVDLLNCVIKPTTHPS